MAWGKLELCTLGIDFFYTDFIGKNVFGKRIGKIWMDWTCICDVGNSYYLGHFWNNRLKTVVLVSWLYVWNGRREYFSRAGTVCKVYRILRSAFVVLCSVFYPHTNEDLQEIFQSFLYEHAFSSRIFLFCI